MKTYNDIYITARKKLKEAGIEAYALEARLIVAAAAGKTKEDFLKDLNLYVADDFEEKVNVLLRRRLHGEPVAYVVNEWEFYGLPVYVTEDVLIPRVDTEVLVDHAIKMLKGREGDKRVLDLCCGSGCISVAIAANVPSCRVIAVDDSLKALSVCRQNVLKNNQTRSITCIDADALSSPPMLLGRFDMIVCNPPYIPTKDLVKLDPSVRDYEPVVALDGGRDGLDYYRKVSKKWKTILKAKGCMLFECGIGQADQVKKIMEENGFTNVAVFKDTLGIDRVIAGVSAASDTE